MERAFKRIGVAISGGVDSALTGLLLKQAGYEIEAWHMLLPKLCGDCSLESDPHGDADAAAMAEWLGVPFHAIDCAEAFERAVVSPFAMDYSLGRTPNPCTYCNPRIKFGFLRDAMMQAGCDAIATGHYARLACEASSGAWTIHRATDQRKDQSYFLYALTLEQLNAALFPLGEMTHAEVREQAKAAGIPVYAKKSSQDICFLPDGDYRPLVRSRYPDTMRAGAIIDASGKVLGEHQGLANYTLGQRRGLGVATGGRVFVTAFDREANTVTLGPREDLMCHRFTVREVSWQVPQPTFPLVCHAVSRYHAAPFECVVTATEDGSIVAVTTTEPQFLISTGQACVFYRNDAVLGGGLIAQR